jgi:hypothetical protein
MPPNKQRICKLKKIDLNYSFVIFFLSSFLFVFFFYLLVLVFILRLCPFLKINYITTLLVLDHTLSVVPVFHLAFCPFFQTLSLIYSYFSYCNKFYYRECPRRKRWIFSEVIASVILSKKEKMYVYTCHIPNCFGDRVISLYSCKIVDKKEILPTVCNTGIYCLSDKAFTVELL